MQQLILTPEDLREKLKISKTTYFRLLQSDPPLPSLILPVGGRRHRQEDVEAWLEIFQLRKRRGRPRKRSQMEAVERVKP